MWGLVIGSFGAIAFGIYKVRKFFKAFCSKIKKTNRKDINVSKFNSKTSNVKYQFW